MGGLGERDRVCLVCRFCLVHVRVHLVYVRVLHARTGMRVGPGTASSHGRATREVGMTGSLRADVMFRNLTGALEASFPTCASFPLLITFLNRSC